MYGTHALFAVLEHRQAADLHRYLHRMMCGEQECMSCVRVGASAGEDHVSAIGLTPLTAQPRKTFVPMVRVAR